MDITIHEAISDAHIQRVLVVRNAVEIERLTLAGLRAERSSLVDSLDVIAEVDGRDVGAGSTAWGPVSAESRMVFAFAWVLPEWRRNGIGGSLVERLVAFVRARGMERMTTFIYADDADSVAFATRRGLVVDGGGQLGKLDLGGPPVDRGITPIAGVEVLTLADRPEFERNLYDIDALVHPEIPFLANEPMPSFEAWQATGTGDPGFLPDLTMLAVEKGRLIGGVQVYDNGDEVVFIGMTSVDPDARRRGVARLLKAELERRARAAGKRRIETYNDGANERIRGLNESLGYVYNPPYAVLRGPLPPPRDQAPGS